MKKILYFIFYFLSFSCFSSLSQLAPAAATAQKKIIIFTSKGGGGHMAVSNALNNYLKDDYKLTIVNMFQDVLSNWDKLGVLTFGKFTGEDFYNYCLQCRWLSMANRYMESGSWIIRQTAPAIERDIENYVRLQKPDLLISVIPLVNFIILKVAKKFKLPFLVVTNDLDTINYVHALKKPNYNKFYYTLAFDDPKMFEKIKQAEIPKKQIKVTGFPVRPDFFKKKDKQKIKKEFNIPNNKPVIMLLMGGAGSLASVRYVKILARSQAPLHLIVCLGRNEKLRRHINRIILPKHFTISVIGFTDKISDLMAVSDLLITKPGPGSICEAIASNLPIIIDKTAGALAWELMNIELVEKHRFGDVLTNFNQLKSVLDRYLRRPGYAKGIKQNMINFKKENFERNIKSLIASIV